MGLAIPKRVGDPFDRLNLRIIDRIDYRQPVPPPQLSPSDRLWLEALLQKTV